MGKCQGIMETLGRTMTTLCLEKKRNVNIQNFEIVGSIRSSLSYEYTKSQKIIFTIQCSIKSDANEFRKWANERATKYVFDLKEEKNQKITPILLWKDLSQSIWLNHQQLSLSIQSKT